MFVGCAPLNFVGNFRNRGTAKPRKLASKLAVRSGEVNRVVDVPGIETAKVTVNYNTHCNWVYHFWEGEPFGKKYIVRNNNAIWIFMTAKNKKSYFSRECVPFLLIVIFILKNFHDLSDNVSICFLLRKMNVEYIFFFFCKFELFHQYKLINLYVLYQNIYYIMLTCRNIIWIPEIKRT